MSLAQTVRALHQMGVDLSAFVEYVRPILVRKAMRKDFEPESYDPLVLATGMMWLNVEELKQVEEILAECQMELV